MFPNVHENASPVDGAANAELPENELMNKHVTRSIVLRLWQLVTQLQ